MHRHTIISAYNATEEAADGLALAHLLADVTGSDLLVVHVLRDMIEHGELSLAQQQRVRGRMTETRRAIVAALPRGDDGELMPVIDPSLARGLHDAARRAGAAMIVLGSSHHGVLGRALLGGSTDLLVPGAPCPVAIAPPGFRDHASLDPPLIGVAFDGSPPAHAALAFATDLADAAGVPLRALRVHAPWYDRPLAHGAPVDDDTTIVLDGDPGHALATASATLGLLVIGTRGRGPVRRALLGSVSRRVVREACCPVIVVP